MKAIKIVILSCLLLLFLSVYSGFAQTMTVLNYFFQYYNQFSLADLGFEGSSCRKEFFRLDFGGSSASNYYIRIQIGHASLIGGTSYGTVVDGETDPYPYDAKFLASPGPQWTNCEIANDSDFDFDADIINNTFEDRYKAINGFPEGRYTVTFTLTPDGPGTTVERTVTFTVRPYYLTYLSPGDGESVTETSLIFRFRTNLSNLSLHLYDARGVEIKYGKELPMSLGNGGSGIPTMYTVFGSSFKSVLDLGETYYWRVEGDQNLSRSPSEVYTKGEMMEFSYGKPGTGGGADEIVSFLTEEEKDMIMQMLLDTLQSGGKNKESRQLERVDAVIRDVTLDGEAVSSGHVISILESLKSGDYDWDIPNLTE